MIVCNTACDAVVRSHLDAILARITTYTRTKARTIRTAVKTLHENRMDAHQTARIQATRVGYVQPLCVGFVRELDRRVAREFASLHGLLLSEHKQGGANRPVDWSGDNVELSRNLWPYRHREL